jgi:hypothetical protein
VAPAEAAAGDPLSLRLHVTGSGNFDRVDTAMLGSLTGWKTYPPRASFKEGDTLGDKGEKTFEQTVIASAPGVQTLPALAFSFFNPSTGHYETARSAPLTVTIARSLADSSLSPPSASPPGGAGGTATGVVATGAAGGALTGTPSTGFRADHALNARSTDSLQPPYLTPPFLTAYSLLSLSISAAYLVMRQRRTRGAGGGLRRGRSSAREIARTLAQLEATAAATPQLFFATARRALQSSLAARWQLTPEEITAQEIGARLSGAGQELQELFALADEVHYAGRSLSAADYARWSQVVVRQMTEEHPS